MGNNENSAHHATSNGFPKLPPIHLEKVTFAQLKNGLKDIWGMAIFKKEVYEKVERRHEEGISVAFAYLLLSALAYPLGKFLIGDASFGRLYRTTITEFLFGAGFAMVGAVVVLFLLQIVITKIFNGKATFEQFIRVMGYVAGFGILQFLNPISGLVSLWCFVMTVFAIKNVHKLSLLNSVLTLILPSLCIGLFLFLMIFLGFGFLLPLLGMQIFF